MKTKPPTFLSKIKSLFSFSGAEPEVKQEYWDNGKLKIEAHYKNGQKEGVETGWYESGEKNYEVNYINGKREGLQTFWYESGQKRFESNFKNGEPFGMNPVRKNEKNITRMENQRD